MSHDPTMCDWQDEDHPWPCWAADGRHLTAPFAAIDMTKSGQQYYEMGVADERARIARVLEAVLAALRSNEGAAAREGST